MNMEADRHAVAEIYKNEVKARAYDLIALSIEGGEQLWKIQEIVMQAEVDLAALPS